MPIMQELPSTTASETRREVAARVGEWLALLNSQEVERRKQVNDKHLAERGRMLYPEGGQYAKFYLDKPGRRYTRVVMETEGGDRSVHAFFDPSNGDVYKSASWKAPASGVRFNLLSDESRADMFARMGFAGGYLYAR